MSDRTDRKGRKKCGDCRYQAVAPPSLGRRSLGTHRTKEEAEAAVRRALTDHERGIDLAPRKVTVAQLFERYFEAERAELQPSTLHRYQEIWKLHVAPTLESRLVVDVKPAHIKELYAKLRREPITYRWRPKARAGTEKRETTRSGKPLGPNSVLRIHRVLHRVFGWAERNGLASRNVIRLVESPKGAESPAQALSTEQIAALLKAAEGSRLHPFFVVGAMTGMRRGEVGALTWDAIDFERGIAHVRQAIGDDRRGSMFVKSTKTGKQRVVPLNGVALAALRAQRAVQAQDRLLSQGCYVDRGFVFADELGGILDLDLISKAFASIAQRVGIKARGVSLHSLRHSVATLAIEAGTDIRTVAALIGHAAASTTLNIYGHVVAGAQERAVTAIGDALGQAQARAAVAENRPA